MISEKDGAFLLGFARQVIEDYVNGKQSEIPKKYPDVCKEKFGVFCTLHRIVRGEKRLRGCVGIPYPTMLLIDALREAATSSTEDSRFPTLRRDELKDILVEVSVLTRPELIIVDRSEKYVDEIIPNKDGLILEYGHYSGLFLPQVWEQIPDKKQFLDHLCMKAGLEPGMWKLNGVKIYRFHVQVFEEK
jgi:AmmeMemoRadiSam system protein A